MREETYSEKSVQVAIEALERLMDEEEGGRQAKHVVVFRVFVGQNCVGGRAPFSWTRRLPIATTAISFRGCSRKTMATDSRATRATVQLHAPIGRVWRHTAE
jgi:hypothetical protein